MFKIDKSSVEYIDSNKEVVFIKQWLRQNVREFEQPDPEPLEKEEEIGGYEFEQEADHPGQEGHVSPEEVLRCAESEAKRLIDEAMAQTEQIRLRVEQETAEQGEQRVQALCEQIQRENAEQLETALKKLFELQQRYEASLEQRVLPLSLEIAQKILNRTLEKDDTVFEGVIRQAVQKVNLKGECTLRLNPREYNRHFKDGGKWLSQEIEIPYTVMADNAIPPGGCVLELQDCVIRVGIDAQIKMIAMALNQ